MRNSPFLMTLYVPQDQRNKRFFQYAFGDPFQPPLRPGHGSLNIYILTLL